MQRDLMQCSCIYLHEWRGEPWSWCNEAQSGQLATCKHRSLAQGNGRFQFETRLAVSFDAGEQDPSVCQSDGS
jgi:hypothetical protein